MILGIDEAGRGPCIGPMVMCGVLIKENQKSKLKSLNIKDSKLVSKKNREILFKELKKKEIIIDYKIIKLSPIKIDQALNSDKSNLNFLEAQTTIKIFNSLKKKHKIKKIITDCPSINTKAYLETLKKLAKTKTTIISEHKADEKYISVSSASILAKVTRDKEIEKLQKKYGALGSGYPSDKYTQEFIKLNWKKFKDEGLFRKTWSPYKKIENLNKQRKLFDY